MLNLGHHSANQSGNPAHFLSFNWNTNQIWIIITCSVNEQIRIYKHWAKDNREGPLVNFHFPSPQSSAVSRLSLNFRYIALKQLLLTMQQIEPNWPIGSVIFSPFHRDLITGLKEGSIALDVMLRQTSACRLFTDLADLPPAFEGRWSVKTRMKNGC